MKSVLVIMFLVFSYVLTLENVESTISDLEVSLCTEEKCIMKCCPVGKYITIKRGKGRICSHFDNVTDFASLATKIFVEYPELSKLNLTEKAGIFETSQTFKTKSLGASSWYKLHLTEYPELYLDMPNAYKRWTRIPNDRFCWDYKGDGSNKSARPDVWALLPENHSEYEPITTLSSTILITAMLVTCFFLLLVLAVYVLLPDLRSLCGMVFMAFVASLFLAFLLLAFMRMQLLEPLECRRYTYAIYYFFMASFCWMTVMSYHVWRTLRSYAENRPVYRRRDWFQFLLYCLFGFGLPLAMMIVLVIVNEVDMTHMPWFVTPKIPINGCFIEGSEKFLYLYVPMLILMFCDWIFCLKAGITLWRLNRSIQECEDGYKQHTHRMHINKFIVYVKLIVVLSLDWLLQVVSHSYPGFSAWLIADLYNVLIGVTIFLIYVFKRQIRRRLWKRWQLGQIFKVWTARPSGTGAHVGQESQILPL